MTQTHTTMTDKIPTCVTCKHVRQVDSNPGSGNRSYSEYRCFTPRLVPRLDPVTGGEMLCSTARSDGEDCGYYGSYWESMNDAKPVPE